MSELRCLLMTDLVDSTQLVEQLGDERASALWQAHDRSARELLREWNGREIDKSDGFLLLFASVEEAVGYVLAYHRALAALAVPLTARAGLHHGAITLRHNAPGDVALGAKSVEVDGHAKSVAARVMALAAPAQTLMTAEARAQLGERPLNLQPCGHWRFKGVQTPMELFVATEPGLPVQAPRDMDKAYRVVHRDGLWVPFAQTRHSLPAERDPFVGRQKPLDELQSRLRDGARLVSMLGIGGTGKSRLAQRFGWLWLGDYPGGVWFCDLSQAHSLQGIAYAVAQGLDVPLGAGDPIVQLGNAIAGRGECLVICDNFEQVARLAEASLGRWLDQAAQARFIVTTREVLGIPGETSLPLAPMDQAEAVRLFSLRAAAATEGMPARPEDDAATQPLVRLLDGLPLAIELAAARTRVMSPRELLQRMNDRFKVLASTGGRRDRQATLRATFDWSWGLLSAAEKAAFAQLSVFEMGFRLPAAEAVLQIPEAESSVWALDVLQMLVEKSLVRRMAAGRFDMLGSVREYAAEHLSTCQASAAQQWLEARQADLLPVAYYHVVFTLPAPIADIAYYNKAVVYALLFDSAAETLLTIGADAKHLGARLGITLVLHTWGSALTHHPHVHGIVPGGGLSADGQRWIACRPGFFLPVRVLSRLFRRRFLEALLAAHHDGRLQFFGEHASLVDRTAFARWLAPLRQCEWVVYAKQPFAGPEAVLAYLSRYTHRVAISNSRLVALDQRGVTFRWKDYRAKGRTRHKTMTLEPREFMRRFLLHVLPGGFHRIRHYGFLANCNRSASLTLARQLLHVPPAPEPPRATARDDPPPTFVCSHCGHPMVIVQTFVRGATIRAPPCSAAA